MTLADEVVRIVALQAVRAPETITPEMTIGDVGLDSIGMVEVYFAVEERFDVTIPMAANAQSADFRDVTVGELAAEVERLVQARP